MTNIEKALLWADMFNRGYTERADVPGDYDMGAVAKVIKHLLVLAKETSRLYAALAAAETKNQNAQTTASVGVGASKLYHCRVCGKPCVSLDDRDTEMLSSDGQPWTVSHLECLRAEAAKP